MTFDEPLVVSDQGSFFAGGDTTALPNGDQVMADHAYVQFQRPAVQTGLPLLLWHGGSTSGKTWESTPDRREGFQTLMLRRGLPVYCLDQPRRGRAGRTTVGTTIDPHDRSDARSWNIWRLGVWEPPARPTFFTGVQFPQDDASVEQFLRQRTPTTGPEHRNTESDRALVCDAVHAAIDEIGPLVIVAHSDSGQYAWLTAATHDNVKGIIAYEPGTFGFPSDDLPDLIDTDDPLAAAVNTPMPMDPRQFEALARIPIQVVYGDNIRAERSSNTGAELWRLNTERVEQFRSALEKRGGSVEILRLPEVGLRGNTHFPFSDLNNCDVADLAVSFLQRNGLQEVPQHDA